MVRSTAPTRTSLRADGATLDTYCSEAVVWIPRAKTEADEVVFPGLEKPKSKGEEVPKNTGVPIGLPLE